MAGSPKTIELLANVLAVVSRRDSRQVVEPRKSAVLGIPRPKSSTLFVEIEWLGTAQRRKKKTTSFAGEKHLPLRNSWLREGEFHKGTEFFLALLSKGFRIASSHGFAAVGAECVPPKKRKTPRNS